MMTYSRRAGRMVDEVARRLGIEDDRIIEAVAAIPRHLFVDEALRPRAYTDDALPIGYGQTISKVSTVLTMTSALDPKEGESILEIGTGSGFQCAVLSQLCREVHSVERIAGQVETFYHGAGCKKCRNSGYSGRIGIYELMLPNEELAEHITRAPSVQELRQLAIDQGMTTLRQDGMQKVKAGITTVEEVFRVTAE